MKHYISYHYTTLGWIKIICSKDKLCYLHFCKQPPTTSSQLYKPNTLLTQKVIQQVEAYLAGEREYFDIPLAPTGTAFQLAVWKALCQIPYGYTTSYKAIAIQIGKPQAARAVGMANHRNPIAILIPCHRVISISGKLQGYAAGVEIKAKLLQLEKRKAVVL